MIDEAVLYLSGYDDEEEEDKALLDMLIAAHTAACVHPLGSVVGHSTSPQRRAACAIAAAKARAPFPAPAYN